MWKSLLRGSYALHVGSEHLFTQVNLSFPRSAVSFTPLRFQQFSVSSGEVLFTLISEFTPCCPQIVWLEQASPNHQPSQPVSSHTPPGRIRTRLPSPPFENMCWQEWAVWHGGDTSWRPSQVSGMALGRRFSGACFLSIPSPLQELIALCSSNRLYPPVSDIHK